MRSASPIKFSNSFLFLRGEQAVVHSFGNEEHRREKRVHTKSRNGCSACKKRRVKCDEAFPCGNCKKRKETCEQSDPRPPPPPKVTLVQQPGPQPFRHVNSFHIELFYHFEKLTVPTLAFSEIWPVLLQLSFHNEFLMHAILSLAAKHLSILRPQDLRYTEAAMVMLNKSIQSYRESLSSPITLENCDSRLGTSILINYMAWNDLGFLEGQSIVANPAAGGLDLSGDLLFLLSSGVRQVFFTAYPIFRDHGSIFTTIARYHPCDHLEAEAERRGTGWREIMQRFMVLFDDPRYIGASPDSHQDQTPTPSTDVESLEWYYTQAEGWTTSQPASQPLYARYPSSSAAMTAFNAEYMDHLIQSNGDQHLAIELAEKGITARTIYERIAHRLAVILSLIPFIEGEGSSPGGTATATLSEARLRDVERYFFSFPMILCFGPFLPLILDGDSRALVILHHTYRAAKCLLTSERSWWSGERAEVMEKLILYELKARGLSAGI